MLPQNTEVGIFSWRFLVLSLQLFGMFPFSVSSAHRTPKFSPLLFLWSVFLVFFTIYVSYFTVTDLLFPLMIPNVGSTTFIYSVSFMLVSQIFMSVTMLIHSSKLSEILADIASVPELCKPAENDRSYMLSCVVLVLINGGGAAFCYWYSVYIMGIQTVIQVVCLSLYSVALYSPNFIILDLSTKVFDLLSRQLLNATIVVSHTSRDSTRDFVPDTTLPSLYLHLHDIERKIYQVSKFLIFSMCGKFSIMTTSSTLAQVFPFSMFFLISSGDFFHYICV